MLLRSIGSAMDHGTTVDLDQYWARAYSVATVSESDCDSVPRVRGPSLSVTVCFLLGY
jgi:hypothetical protein